MTDPGSDFERRVAEALAAPDDPAPDPTGLADAARERARRRTRARTTGVVVAVVLAVAAVPLALSLGDGSADPPAPSTASTTPTADADGVRVETYRDLEIDVPVSWGHGTLSTWCLDGRTEPGTPVVERPGGVVPAIGCSDPGSGYGVRFFDASRPGSGSADLPGDLVQQGRGRGGDFPPGSWAGRASDTSGDVGVLVVARSEREAREVLDSARTVEGADTNGCAVRRDGPAPAVADGTVAVCRYDADEWLEQSELLTGSDATAAVTAVDEAPPDEALGPGVCTDPVEFGEVLLREPGRDVAVVYGSTCAHDNGIRWGAGRRQLTADVLYWALSPGWAGAVYGPVPPLHELRR